MHLNNVCSELEINSTENNACPVTFPTSVLHWISREKINDPLFRHTVLLFPRFFPLLFPLFNLFTSGGWHLIHLLHPQRHLQEERNSSE